MTAEVEKNKRGRPTEYKEEYIQEADAYLEESQDEYDEFHKTRGDNTNSYERLVRVRLPTIEGFCLRLDINKTTIYRWEKEHDEFSNALDKIRKEQKDRLIKSGLSGDYNPTIAKLVLSANHGMAEKTETKIDATFNHNNLLDELEDNE